MPLRPALSAFQNSQVLRPSAQITPSPVMATRRIGYWAGARGFVRHSKVQYRFPPFEGDATFIDGEVTDVRIEELLAVPVATIKVTLTNQDGSVLAAGNVEVELPR